MKVIQIIPNLVLAGAETMCATLSEELYKTQIEVTVISLYSYHSAITDRLEKYGIHIIYLGKKRGPDPKIIIKLYKLFREIRPQIVHTHLYVMPYVLPAAIMARIKKRIHTVHNIADKEATGAVRYLNNMFYHLNNVVPIALTEEVKDTIHDLYHIPLHRIPVIYNGVNLDKCIRKQEYKQGEKLRYIHIGRFTEQKNHDMLLDAFMRVQERIPEIELYLLGEGKRKYLVEKKVHSLRLEEKVRFEGEQSDVYTYLKDADVFILPSIYEGMPMSIIEAMGTGLPIIASNVGGIPTMIEDGKDGLLVDVNVDSIAKAMLRMYDEKLREYLGRNAIKKAESYFSSKAMAEKYIDLYGGNT